MKKYDYHIYERLLRKYIGLQGMGIKLPIRDVKALSLVYTPGVAASCLEIQKNNDNAYKYTNKGNSMFLITDSSAGNFNRDKWNDKAPIPYLEGFATIYKKLANIDCYPLILKKGAIKDGKELAELLQKIMPAYSSAEFYNVDEELIKHYLKHKDGMFADIKEKSKANKKAFLNQFYATAYSVDRQKLQQELDDKGVHINAHLLYAAAFRVALDTQSYINLNDCIEEMKEFAIRTYSSHNNRRVYATMTELIEFAYLYFERVKSINFDAWKSNLTYRTVNKEEVLFKYERFITEGERGWVCEFPDKYYTNMHSTDENSLLLHQRHKGIIEVQPKIPFQSVEEMLRLLSYYNFEVITSKIIENINIARYLTFHGNLGAIMTNGTAVLGLGNIGALAGLPVMEGKSVLFKLFGGVDIIPFCINELDQEKFVRICEIISPIFSIVNLEDIKAPECFYIESEFDKRVDYPIFHDDQHGTAIVSLAGIINSLKLTKKKIEDIKVVMNGAGAAGLTIADLLITYGVKHFIVCDTNGALYKDRKENMNPFKRKIAEITNEQNVQGSLKDVIVGADVFIGVSVAGALTKEMVLSMNKDPIIFALANPIPEILPEDAIEAGAFIVATGRSDYPNQINNSMAFPGIFRAAVDTGTRSITKSMKIAAAEGIAQSIEDKDIRVDRIVPLSMDTNSAITVAKSVAKVVERDYLITRQGVSYETVEENIDSWFHEGDLRIRI